MCTDRFARTAAPTTAACFHTVLFEVRPVSMTGPRVKIGLDGIVNQTEIIQRACAHL